jgi:2-methylcitrate dehydratase PrpD
MSIPYVVALALRDGAVGMEQFGESARSDALVRSCVERVEVVMDPELNADYPRTRPARVTIKRTDGRVLTSLVEQPLGEPSNPMDDAAVTRKARDLCSSFIGSERTETMISEVLEGSDLRSLMAGLASPSC